MQENLPYGRERTGQDKRGLEEREEMKREDRGLDAREKRMKESIG